VQAEWNDLYWNISVPSSLVQTSYRDRELLDQHKSSKFQSFRWRCSNPTFLGASNIEHNVMGRLMLGAGRILSFHRFSLLSQGFVLTYASFQGHLRVNVLICRNSNIFMNFYLKFLWCWSSKPLLILIFIWYIWHGELLPILSIPTNHNVSPKKFPFISLLGTLQHGLFYQMQTLWPEPWMYNKRTKRWQKTQAEHWMKNTFSGTPGI